MKELLEGLGGNSKGGFAVMGVEQVPFDLPINLLLPSKIQVCRLNNLLFNIPGFFLRINTVPKAHELSQEYEQDVHASGFVTCHVAM